MSLDEAENDVPIKRAVFRSCILFGAATSPPPVIEVPSLLAFANAAEPFRIANPVAEKPYALATTVADQMIYDAVLAETAPQRVAVQSRVGSRIPKLSRALEIMKAGLEKPLSPSEIIRTIGL